MTCPCCAFGDTADQQFNSGKVAQELRQYRRKGLAVTTRKLRDGLVSAGLTQGDVLDVGGGLGTLSLALLDAGLSQATVVDASSAYLAAASDEAARRGRSTSMQFVHGDFLAVSLAPSQATVVTLDRVVCCYPLFEPLLRALQRADRGFAISYPRDRWYVRLGVWCENALRRWRGNPFRTFVHRPAAMHRIIQSAGFTLASRAQTMVWSADVFRKVADSQAGRH
jgi:SAM-dependent methyltransferase